MALNAQILGERLRAARQAAKLDVPDAAAQIGRDGAWLDGVEHGTVSITLGQILDLAQQYGVDAGELIRGRATGRLDAAKFRAAGHKLTPAQEGELAGTFRMLSCAEDLRHLLGPPATVPSFTKAMPDPKTWDEARRQGLALAREVRQVLGLGVEPVTGVLQLVHGLGITVLEADLPEDISGLSQNRGGTWPVIVTARQDLSERTRFSAAHELAHHIVDNPTEPIVSTWFSKRLDEARADAFAGDLLLPKESIEHWAEGRGKSLLELHFADLADLSVDFDLSYACVAYRFFLGEFTTKEGYQQLRAESTRGAGRRRATAFRLNKLGNSERAPGLRTEGWVWAGEARTRGLITDRKYAEYCQIFGLEPDTDV